MLVADEVEQLAVVNCKLLGASGDGLALRRVSGRIADCDIGGCRNMALVGEDPRGLEVARNHVHDCGDIGILVRRSNEGETGSAFIAENVIHRVATGIAVDGQAGGARLAVVQRNHIRNLFFRKTVDPSGNGIAIEADSVVTGNVIDNVPGFGIVAGRARRLERCERDREYRPQRLYRDRHPGASVRRVRSDRRQPDQRRRKRGHSRHERADAHRPRPRPELSPATA